MRGPIGSQLRRSEAPELASAGDKSSRGGRRDCCAMGDDAMACSVLPISPAVIAGAPNTIAQPSTTRAAWSQPNYLSAGQTSTNCSGFSSTSTRESGTTEIAPGEWRAFWQRSLARRVLCSPGLTPQCRSSARFSQGMFFD